MKTKESKRFFDDTELAKEVNLTKKEVEIFDSFEWDILCDNGLRQINGGYSSVTIYDIEEDEGEGELLRCEVECGEQDMGQGYSRCNKWQVKYNRKTEKFEED